MDTFAKGALTKDARSIVTIAIPVYERKDYFLEALDSAIDQTIPCRIIVIDNCSSHEFFREAVQERELKSGAHILYFNNERNLGLFGNWNRCAELSSTPYFLVLCDDDSVKPEFIEEFLSALDRHPELDFYYTQLERFGPTFLGHEEQAIRFGHFNGDEVLVDAAVHGLVWPTNATVYRTDHVLRRPWRNPSPKRHSNSDWLLVYELAPGRICVGNPKPLYRLRSHPANAGKANEVYVQLSRSEIFFEIGKKLQAAGDVRHAVQAFEKSAIAVTDSYILNPRAFVRLISVGLVENDAFIVFVKQVWAKHSPVVRMLMPESGYMRQAVAWIALRTARFLARFRIHIYKQLASGGFAAQQRETH